MNFDGLVNSDGYFMKFFQHDQYENFRNLATLAIRVVCIVLELVEHWAGKQKVAVPILPRSHSMEMINYYEQHYSSLRLFTP